MNPLETKYSSSLTDEQFGAYVDVDFVLEARRHRRLMGAEPRQESFGMAGAPAFRDMADIIPRSQWQPLWEAKNANGGTCRPMVRYVHDQDGEPSCVSNTFLAGHAIKQVELLGADKLSVLSPISLYRFVGTPRSGSTLTANMRRMQEIGALPLDNAANKARFKHTHPHNGYSRELPSGWQETAALFRNHEYADIETLEEFVTALLCGHPVVYARSGHCILAIGVVFRNGALYIEYLNSWGDWGAALNEHFSYGVGFDSERVARSASYGAMAILSIQSPVLALAA